MSDSQLVAFFKRPSGGSVCGRFAPDQLERDILIPGKRIPWMKYFFQIVIPAFLFSQKTKAQGEVRILKGDTVLVQPEKQKDLQRVCVLQPGEKSLKLLTGKIIDEDGNGVPYASVMIKGTKNGTICDNNGAFKIGGLKNSGTITLISSCVGFSSIEKVVNICTDSNLEINMVSEKKTNGEVVLVCSSGLRGRVMMGAMTTVTRTTIFQKVKEVFVKDSIKIYPNPVKKGEVINIKWDKRTAGEYKFEIYNLQGQLLQTELLKNESEYFNYSFRLRALPAGIYFLKAINKKTNKVFSEKIMVQ